MRELPLAIPPIREAMQWHMSNNNDPALRWLVEQVVLAAQHEEAGSTSGQVISLDRARAEALLDQHDRRQCAPILARRTDPMTDAIRLDGKVAIITGGAGGIGAATARLLTARGARVVIADIASTGPRTLADELPNAIGLHLDLADEGSIEAMIGQTIAQLGQLDVLHNNAALLGPEIARNDGDVEHMATELWDRTYRDQCARHDDRLPRRAAAPARHARQHRQHRQQSGAARASDPGRLCQLQGGADPADPRDCRQPRQARRALQRGRAGDDDDPGAARSLPAAAAPAGRG